MQLYEFNFSCMGCPCRISLYADSIRQARSALELARSEVVRLDLKYSHYREDSELQTMQRLAMTENGVAVDSETAALLNYAEVQFQESDARFDITARSLTALWDRIESLPSDRKIQAALKRTGWQKLSWNGSRLRLPAGMSLDFGGIVKEYAADRVGVLLRVAGVRSGYVDLGGDLHFLGPHPDGSAWRTGIRNPTDRSQAVATIEVMSGALASSGDYERFSRVDGKRYGHIIDPTNGWPVEGLASVSVIAPSCLLAGSIATLAMLRNESDGLVFLDKCGLPWLAVDQAQNLSGSAGFLPANELIGSPVFHKALRYPACFEQCSSLLKPQGMEYCK